VLRRARGALRGAGDVAPPEPQHEQGFSAGAFPREPPGETSVVLGRHLRIAFKVHVSRGCCDTTPSHAFACDTRADHARKAVDSVSIVSGRDTLPNAHRMRLRHELRTTSVLREAGEFHSPVPPTSIAKTRTTSAVDCVMATATLAVECCVLAMRREWRLPHNSHETVNTEWDGAVHAAQLESDMQGRVAYARPRQVNRGRILVPLEQPDIARGIGASVDGV
jgi:hypothetical protein